MRDLKMSNEDIVYLANKVASLPPGKMRNYAQEALNTACFNRACATGNRSAWLEIRRAAIFRLGEFAPQTPDVQ